MVKAKKVRARIGRPPMAAADRRETPVQVLTTEDEYEELKRAAAGEGMSVSSWVRVVALRRARYLAKRVRQEEKSKQEKHGSGS